MFFPPWCVLVNSTIILAPDARKGWTESENGALAVVTWGLNLQQHREMLFNAYQARAPCALGSAWGGGQPQQGPQLVYPAQGFGLPSPFWTKLHSETPQLGQLEVGAFLGQGDSARDTTRQHQGCGAQPDAPTTAPKEGKLSSSHRLLHATSQCWTRMEQGTVLLCTLPGKTIYSSLVPHLPMPSAAPPIISPQTLIIHPGAHLPARIHTAQALQGHGLGWFFDS